MFKNFIDGAFKLGRAFIQTNPRMQYVVPTVGTGLLIGTYYLMKEDGILQQLRRKKPTEPPPEDPRPGGPGPSLPHEPNQDPRPGDPSTSESVPDIYEKKYQPHLGEDPENKNPPPQKQIPRESK